MKSRIAKAVSLSLTAVLVLSMMAIAPAFSGFPVRHYPGTGKGSCVLYVDPQDSKFESTKPIINKTGTEFTVEVRIANATFIAGWQVELTYDATILSTNTSAVSYAPDMIFPPGSYSPIAPDVGVYNGTYNYALMTATTTGAIEYNATDAGLMKIIFTIIKDPNPTVLSCKLYIQVEAGIFGSWTTDTNLGFDNELFIHDGYYENRYVPPPPPHLEISPTVKKMPVIEGDRILGTPKALFSLDILIKGVDPADELFFVQLNLTWDPALLKAIWIDEGTFMNNPAWAPDGTTDNATIIEEDPPGSGIQVGIAYYWIMINPNATGYWPSLVWPSGNGLLATARFEVIWQDPDSDGHAPEELLASSPIELHGVFGEYFINHPNLPDPPYCPYDPPVNGRVDIYGYYWAVPVAAFTWTPETPLVEELVTFDASASYGFRNVDPLVPDPTYIAWYQWSWDDGTPDNWTVNPIMTHKFMAMGDYDVTLTVWDLDNRTGSVTHTVTVIFGRLIDVFVGTCGSPYPAPYGGQKLMQVADMFEPQKTVCVWALVTYNGDPVQSKIVTFIVLSPSGLHDFVRTAETNASGFAYIEFGIPWPCADPETEIFGIWEIIVKVDIRSIVVEDHVWFKVWWLVEIVSVVTREPGYIKCNYAVVKVTLRTFRMQPVWVVITIVIYDDLGVPIGFVRIWVLLGWDSYTWCEFKYYEYEFFIHIPKWAFVGVGTVYANAFHLDLLNPYWVGWPCCPEQKATFKILKTP